MPEPLTPVGDAERAALVRFFSPSAERLVFLLSAEQEERWRPGIAAAASRGFERLHVAEVVQERFVRGDLERKKAFVARAVVEKSAWSLERLADLLDDGDRSVREASWTELRRRIPSADAAATAYD